jgi:hypothetical protein
MNSIICSGLAGFLATAPMTLVIFGGRTLGLLWCCTVSAEAATCAAK